MKKYFSGMFFCLLFCLCTLSLPTATAEAFSDPLRQEIKRATQAVLQLNLGNDNLFADYSPHKLPVENARFMRLFRAMLRSVKLFNTQAENYNGEGNQEQNIKNTLPSYFLSFFKKDGAFDDLLNNVVKEVIEPLELSVLIPELLRYYNAVVKTNGWESKFKKLGKMESLEPESFHLAGFPEMETEEPYLTRYYVCTKNNDFTLGEALPLEQWFYSFWLRRYNDGSMDFVYFILKQLESKVLKFPSRFKSIRSYAAKLKGILCS